MNPEHLSIADITALRADGDLLTALKQSLAQARAVSKRRRELVFRHPDLVQRLAQIPGNAIPEAWNGYIPPEIWNQVPNPSRERVALLELVAEAERRCATARGAARTTTHPSRTEETRP
jgi:hypothetical protein